jgi:hypothetical protein
VIRSFVLATTLMFTGFLPGLPAVPDGSEVRILRGELQSVLASGSVKAKKLELATPGGRLPAFERVRVWIAVPQGAHSDLQTYPGQVTETGMDVLIDTREKGSEKVSLSQVLRDSYGIKLSLTEARK